LNGREDRISLSLSLTRRHPPTKQPQERPCVEGDKPVYFPDWICGYEKDDKGPSVIATCAEQCGSDLPCSVFKNVVLTASCKSEGVTCYCEGKGSPWLVIEEPKK